MRNHLRSIHSASLIASTCAAVFASAILPASAESGNPFTGQQQPPPTSAAPSSIRLADSAYDRARGAAGPDSGGRGGWLPIISDAACPSYTVRRPPDGLVPEPLVPDASRAGASPTAGGATGGAASGRDKVASKKSPSTPGGESRTVAEAPLSTPTQPDVRATVSGLRAGSTDDNDRFDDYLTYRRKALASGMSVHDLDVTERHVIRIVDASGRPVLGARVEVSAEDGTPLVDLRTMADGRTLFFPRLSSRPFYSSWTVRVTGGGAETTGRFDRSTAGHSLTLAGATRADRVKLDVQFLIDTTGSMGDEIDRLRANLLSISKSIAALPGQPDVRFAMTVYRDCGDEFVSRTYDFDADVSRFNGELATVRAAGGNDEPEALNQALHDAVTRPGWRGDDTIKMVFLVADAPPHLDYPGDYDYAIDMLLAARRGIKISPIASSGSNPEAEYVFRQLAQATMAKFVFLTYGADGVSPGDRTNLNVDAYETLALDQLVVRLTKEETAWQSPQPPALVALPSGPPRTDTPIAVPVVPPQTAPTTPPWPTPPTTRPRPRPPCRYSAKLHRCVRVTRVPVRTVARTVRRSTAARTQLG